MSFAIGLLIGVFFGMLVMAVVQVGRNGTRQGHAEKNTKTRYFRGGVWYFPYASYNKSVARLDEMLQPYTGDDAHLITLSFCQSLLEQIENREDHWKSEYFISFFAKLQVEGRDEVMLYVKRDCDVGGGLELSLNKWDRAEAEQYSEHTVLMMYRTTGKRAHGGKAQWIPCIRLPQESQFVV